MNMSRPLVTSLRRCVPLGSGRVTRRRFVPALTAIRTLPALQIHSLNCCMMHTERLDGITKKLSVSSKIIVLDGNLAAGKTTLGRMLAEKMGLLYFEEASVPYWEKKSKERALPPPPFKGSCSLENFYADPKSPDGNSVRLQLLMFHTRLLQYSDALEHLLNTGQGVILDRSLYSDFVFVDTMHKSGFLEKHAVDYYYEARANSILAILPPHIVLYLDVPVPEIQHRLIQRGRPFEQNISDSYLQDIEDVYKSKFLPEMSLTSEVLQFDWSTFGDVDKVADCVNSVHLTKGPWLLQTDSSLHQLKMLVENKHRVANLMIISRVIPEVTVGVC
ncbi:NADH dehydrogenase [ubiquinone] 1 alpha subcomplex subunit 10, mitochondrial-like [Petromyzon marinus]|uniref:NADH dehydrogenase [ubiquinone] 1 alpha subcomplex subunit 10, mitochondrial n=1 Tax=Petromyzon marinus TaxID=7757 RepID=A0AAJ7WL02_PETMA|nr:NADH dehydrogenase [ubiquinone] 1 alpha subcomplex subunit 10, mitochondrial-like [Petromyzon marinus]